jgi:hypothetical protein
MNGKSAAAESATGERASFGFREVATADKQRWSRRFRPGRRATT